MVTAVARTPLNLNCYCPIHYLARLPAHNASVSGPAVVRNGSINGIGLLSSLANEVSGIFYWVLEGLSKILDQKRFSDCEAARQATERYKKESDCVAMFMEDENNVASLTETVPLKEIYKQYQGYCGDSGYRSCFSRTFGDRLRKAGFNIDRQKLGMRVWVEKQFVT